MLNPLIHFYDLPLEEMFFFSFHRDLFRDSVNYLLKEKRSEFTNSVVFFKCNVIQRTT